MKIVWSYYITSIFHQLFHTMEGNMNTFYERYIKRDYEGVWSDLQALGPDIYNEEYLGDVNMVVVETMTRIKKNLYTLQKCLEDIGYKFGLYPDGKTIVYGYTTPISPPPQNINGIIMEFEKMRGIKSFPLSIKKFWEIIGDVNFIGYHEKMPKYSDPIVVYPVSSIKYSYSEWEEERKFHNSDVSKFRFPISPDYYHKDNISGGEPYQIEVPNTSVDGSVLIGDSYMPFVSYLRCCFKFSGFYGLRQNQFDLPTEILNIGKNLLEY